MKGYLHLIYTQTIKYPKLVIFDCNYNFLKKIDKTKDWANVQNTTLVMKINMLKLGLVT